MGAFSLNLKSEEKISLYCSSVGRFIFTLVEVAIPTYFLSCTVAAFSLWAFSVSLPAGASPAAISSAVGTGAVVAPLTNTPGRVQKITGQLHEWISIPVSNSNVRCLAYVGRPFVLT